jgi:hypothetical protein
MCQAMIQDVMDWMREGSLGMAVGRAVEFYLTSNEATVNPGINLVSYVKGFMLVYSSGHATWGGSGAVDSIGSAPYGWERITGDGEQTFNDRGHFDVSRRDTVGLSVTLSTPPPSSMPFHLAVDLTLVTWGGGVIPLTGFHCEEGVLFAHAEGAPDRNGTNKVGYTITFKKVTLE